MSAVLDAREARLEPMTVDQVDAVVAIEQQAYSHPWTRGNFIDSLSAGYQAELLRLDGGALAGYYLAMSGVDEMHLLNLTVAPQLQRRGHACALLDALQRRCQEQGVPKLWLEVRASNARARQVYVRRGFAEIGLRRGYYDRGAAPAADAIVMRRDLGRKV